MFVSIKRFTLIKHNLSTILILCFLLFTEIKAIPIPEQGRAIESGEKTFPNGTVIGKYAYLDREGNPVQVKYYADDSSYGVELNSVKMVHKEGSDNVFKKSQKKLDGIVHEKKLEESPFKGRAKDTSNEVVKQNPFDLVDTFKYPAQPLAQKYNAPKEYQEVVSKEAGAHIAKTPHPKGKYKGPEYEIYAKNMLENPTQQCDSNNEKVRVYNFVKEARRVLEVAEDEDDAQFCGF